MPAGTLVVAKAPGLLRQGRHQSSLSWLEDLPPEQFKNDYLKAVRRQLAGDLSAADAGLRSSLAVGVRRAR